jgi:hypothetical protein
VYSRARGSASVSIARTVTGALHVSSRSAAAAAAPRKILADAAPDFS